MSKKNKKLSNKKYEKELYKLQVELCELQTWVKQEGKRVVIIFEGRDTAGKGGVIKRILERVSPRVFQVNALPAPTDRQKTQMYFQRYFERFPAAGEIVIFDRSWYNRAGVERVMGFCTDEEYHRFLKRTPAVEKAILDDDIILIKYWFEVSQEVQFERLEKRIEDPRKHAPWFVVNSDNKKSARLNCISHLLSQIPYERKPFKKPKIKKAKKSEYTPIDYDYTVVPETF
jgi:polyphosphate kinase 2